MRIRWRTFWFLVGFLLFLIALWLAWLLPDLGFFRLDMESLYLPKDGMVLVNLKEGKPANSYSLASYGIGWRAFLELWPLILLSMMVGYPLGVVYHWLFRLLIPEKPVPQENSAKEQELWHLAADQSNKLWLQSLELRDLRSELQQARQEFSDQKVAHGAHRKNTAMFERKTASLAQELTKARAKIKRLEARRR